MKELKPPRAISESSTTSDNTSEFIDIVKKYDVVYNTHNPDYKNVEVKMKVWSQIAEEIGLSVEASKRKWKNLRDSYTKYLRSFRIGTKTSKKYQYWAHADHMEFLKPYQGPGRNSVHNNGKSNDEDDTECDLGFQVLAKATTSSSEEDLKINVSTNSVSSASTSMANTTPNIYTTAMNAVNLAAAAAAAAAALSIPVPLPTNTTTTTAPSMISPGGGSVSTNSNVTPISNMTNASQNASSASALVMPLPALPAVSLPPPGQQQLSSAGKQALTAFASLPTTALPLSASAQQMFPLAPLNASTAKTAAAIPIPVSSTASSVGCLIIEPHLFASADTFKKELSSSSAALGLFHNLTNPATVTSMNATTSRTNPPLFTKIRRVQPSPQTAAINLSFSATGGSNSSGVGSSSSTNQPPAAKSRKTSCPRNSGELDVNAVLQANRDLDANTLFFLSLARQVRAMPMKFQSLAKMRCMRIVSDIELELENVDCNGGPTEEGSGAANMKYCSIDTPPPPQMQDGISIAPAQIAVMNDASTEHFVYVMSPSRVESMIDISSDEDTTNLNGIQ